MKLSQPIGTILLSLLAFPVSYVLNSLTALENPTAVFGVGILVLLALFAVMYIQLRGKPLLDPLFYIFAVFSFTSVIDLIISLEEDGVLSGFMEFYIKEGEPYLRTAYGVMICYWDGTVHYLLYLTMVAAIASGKEYKNVGLYWLGSVLMSIFVFLPGNIIGRYSSDIRPAFLLNLPYLCIPIWAGMKIFNQHRVLQQSTADKVVAEQKKMLFQRPADLVLVVYLLLAAVFTFFRGLVALDCPTDSCFNYLYQHEPYLRDPVAYPKIQMLVYMFYSIPFFCLSVYGLIKPGCTWMLDWTLFFAGAIAQGQFSHIGASLHFWTPYTYRVPESTWWTFVIINTVYGMGAQFLAYRCIQNPDFFLRTLPKTKEENDKKQQ
ncbi:transmembrane 6 superfamily member 2b [Latimeria chalumnae]|uniref:Transmembrane 6 superfamily member 2 n=1 Tax=Latimeria chalumnae TaxID=7897 RepID=H3AUT2_LATCH|nr:PREDICTED: transmembrane 6 superfamily member 2 [Latimeria chalumnae]|eukprot:XP_014345953.1 PREDICTED: transmembrane 6 superfamily member 2 [Latimeria chalumnae]